MAIECFEQLCAQLCDALDTNTPALAPDASGLIGMTLSVHDVNVCIHHAPADAQPAVHISVEFGLVPQALELDALRMLLETNLMLRSVNPPAFARNPLTGEILLQYACTFKSATVTGLLQSIEALACMARQWRGDYFLVSHPVEPDGVGRHVAAGLFA